MSNTETTPIKALISYSWTSDEHIDWVLELATQLTSDGFEIILDRWHTKDGDDMDVFMERIVTDKTVSKVVVICDSGYAKKADNREGGVGVESIIISQEVYRQVQQSKFIPLLAERDDEGKPHLPTFLKGRKYIDFSTVEGRTGNYESLLRALADKPLLTPPPIGKLPSFLLEEGKESSPTDAKRRAVEQAILGGKTTVGGLLEDYFESLAEQILSLRLPEDLNSWSVIDAQLLVGIEKWTPLRDEFMKLMRHTTRYGQGAHLTSILPEFFNFCLQTNGIPNANGSLDVLRFALYEAFLYTISFSIKKGDYAIANSLLEHRYKDPENRGRSSLLSFDAFMLREDRLSQAWTQETKQNWNSPIGNLLQQRANLSFIEFNDLLEPDLILCIRSNFDDASVYGWYPMTVPYLPNLRQSSGTLPMVERCMSRKFFNEFKSLFGVDSKEELVKSWADKAPVGMFGVATRWLNIDQFSNWISSFATKP